MELGVLGALEVRAGGEAAALGGPHQRAVLAALVAQRGRTVAVDVLVDALWGDAPPRSAEHTVRTHVSRLRRVLGAALVTRDGGWALEVPADAVDAGRFDALAGSADAAGLSEALGLWRGPAYAGLADLAPVRGEAGRLEEARASVRERLAGALLAEARPGEAVGVARALVEDAPYREGAWAVLVRALAADGRPADGLEAYRRAAAALDALGLEPSPVLRAAQAAALTAGAPPGPSPDSAEVPPQPVAGRRSGTSAESGDDLLGRGGDLAAVAELTGRARLVTLVGPGGVGKTRLGLAAVRRRAAAHAGGARVAELAAVRDPGAVPAAVAAALGLAVDGRPPEAALARAGALDTVLLVDNCEHVVDAVAAVAEAMLAHAGPLRLVATSRERIGVPGEHVHVVEPLPAGGPETPAHRLFAERARAAGAPGTHDPADVERVVRRLDGLPLAIEMAAARSATLALTDLADLLGDRLDTLQDPRRRGDARHRTLGAVIAWSEALLDADERAALRGWTVFAGAVPAADAAAVTGAADDVAEGLAARSLLAVDVSGTRTRYRMLQTVRSALGPAGPAADRRHAEHFADVARAADEELRGPGERRAVQRLDGVRDEFRAAHAWARGHDPALAERLTRALHRRATSALDDEVLGWAARLAPVLPDGPESAAVHAAVGARLVTAGEIEAGERRARRGLERAADDQARMFALEVLCDAALYAGRLDESAAHGRALHEVARRVGDPVAVAMATCTVAMAAAYAGHAGEAQRTMAELRDPLPAELPPSAAGWLAYGDGEVLLDADPAAAIACLERAVGLADEVRNRFLGGVARVSLVSLQARHGEPAAARRAFAAVVRHWAARGDRTHQLVTLRNLVDLFARLGDDEAGARLWGAVTSPGLAPSFGAEAERLAATRRKLEQRLGTGVFERLVAQGRGRDVDAAAAAALRDLA